MLGPLEVWADGARLELGRRSERALLVLLAAAPGAVVASGTLAEDLWPAGPPPSAATALRIYVSRVRRSLGAHGELLATRPPGYLLDVPPDAVDALRFERLATQGRARAAAGEPEDAARLLAEAGSLWRGPAMAEVADAPLARAQAARLEELRLAVLEDRVECEFACGRHRGVLGELEVLTTLHPLRERLWSLRMLALYRDQRQAEALACYRALRLRLAEDLGVEPGPGVAALQRAILNHDASLAGLHTAPAAPVAALGLPLPARLPSRPEFGFRGRDTVVATLDAALRGVGTDAAPRDVVCALRGEPGAAPRDVVWVGGEPGAGKSTVVAEFLRSVARRGAPVLYGRCEEDLAVPYQPFAEALHHYLKHVPAGDLERHVAEHGGDLAILAPVLRRRVPDLPAPRSLEPDSGRYLLFAAVAGLLGQIADGGPALLVLDDLHRADGPTVGLLRHLLGEHGPAGLLVVATFRSTEVPAGHPLQAAIDATGEGATRLHLGGLAPDDVGGLVAAAGADPADAGLLFERTGGNPFFVIEVLRHRREVGPDSTSPPRRVQEVVAQRVARLGADATAVLSQAAVLGRDVDVGLVAAALGRAEEELLDVFEPAAAAALLLETAPGRFSFTHAVIQQTLYANLTASRRALAHRRAAAALNSLFGSEPVAELARHWAASVTGPANAAEALPHVRRAAEAAMAGLGFEEAVRWYREAIDLDAQTNAVDRRRSVDLQIGLGEAQRLAGDPAHRETLLAAAAMATELPDPASLVRAVLANSRGWFSKWGAVDRERVEFIEVALARCLGDSPERARLLALLSAEIIYGAPWAQRRELAAEAMAMARRLDDPATIARVDGLVFFGLMVPETLSERLATTAEAVALADRQPDPAVRHWAHRLHLYARVESGDVGHLADALPVITETAVASADPQLLWGAGFIASWRALLAGDLADAEALSLAAYGHYFTESLDEAAPILAVQLLSVRRPQGRMAELAADLEGAVASSPGVPLVRALLAQLQTEIGNLDSARELLRAAAADDFAAVPYEFAWLFTMASYAEVAAAVGDRAACATLHDALAPWADQLVYLFFVNGGCVRHYLGLLTAALGRPAEADEHFAYAVAFHDRIAATFWSAQTRLAWAQALGARDEPKRRDLLAEARAIAARHGFDGLLARTAEAG